MTAAALTCPVCGQSGTEAFARIEARTYWRCGTCGARFMDPAAHLTPEAERAQYLHHENDVEDAGYRQFLSKLAEPLLERLAPASEGLDFGCGPGPALAAMLTERGHRMAVYDPFFAPDTDVLGRAYDFVTCTEVIEHFRAPAAEFRTLRRLVRPGGWLGLMTCFQTDDDRFESWHYPKDPTHVVFYREETLHWLAASGGWSCTIPRKDVALLQPTP